MRIGSYVLVMLHNMFFYLLGYFCWQAPSSRTPAMSEHHHHPLTGPCPLPNAFRVLWSLLCSYILAPSGMQSEGTRDPIQNLPPTAPPPSPTLFSRSQILNSSPQTHTFQYYMISFVGIFHPYQAYIRTRLVRFTGVHQIPTGCKRSDFHEKYLAAQPQLEG